MPHYLRMLTYAREPDIEWGPAKDENRFGRYKPKIDKSSYVYQSDINNDDNNSMLNLKDVFSIQL